MSVASAPTLYESAFYGEPLARTIIPPPLRSFGEWWIVGDWNIRLPKLPVRAAPDVQRMASQLLKWTGWSSRRLADLLGTSHTTILKLEAGRPLITGHSGDLRRRIADVHDVVHRVFILAEDNPVKTTQILESAPPGGRSPFEELRADSPTRAYLSAIDLVRPRSAGLLTGDRSRTGGATAPLHE